MNGASVEKQRLIDGAARHGFAVTPKQIDRWRLDRVLPQPGRAGGGRARGVRRPSPEGSGAQLVRLCQFLDEDRSLDRAAFRLWIEDYAVPLDRVRRALSRLAPRPETVFGTSAQSLHEKVEQYGENLLRRKQTKPHVKKMIEDGRFTAVVEGFIGMGLGRAIPNEQQARLGADFEELSGLNRGRTDHWVGGSPWLTGDTTQEIALAGSLLETINADLCITASEAQFEKAKEAFKALAVLRNCAALLQQLHGPNVFGFGVLTESPVGLPMHYADPNAFLGMLALTKCRPDILENSIQIGKSLHATLEALRKQVEDRQPEAT